MRISASQAWHLLLPWGSAPIGEPDQTISRAPRDGSRVGSYPALRRCTVLRPWENPHAGDRVLYAFPGHSPPSEGDGDGPVGAFGRPAGLKRVGWGVVILVGRLGLARLVIPRMAVNTRKTQWLPDSWLSNHAVKAVSLLVRSEGTEQKVVAQMVASGRVMGYMKIADDAVGRWLLCNERRVLTQLSDEGRTLAPRVLSYTEPGDATYLGTTTIEGESPGSSFGGGPRRVCSLEPAAKGF